MAITLGKVNLDNRNHVFGNRREVVVDFTLDNSYPTGGYPLTYATLGVDIAPDTVVAHSSTGHTFGYDYANQKLKVFSAGTEITNATDLHTVTGRLTARGKGYPSF